MMLDRELDIVVRLARRTSQLSGYLQSTNKFVARHRSCDTCSILIKRNSVRWEVGLGLQSERALAPKLGRYAN